MSIFVCFMYIASLALTKLIKSDVAKSKKLHVTSHLYFFINYKICVKHTIKWCRDVSTLVLR